MSIKEDEKRLQNDLLKIYKIIACNRIQNKKDPDFLTASEIEYNGTSRKKTMRLLKTNGYLGRTIQKKDTSSYSYHPEETYWQILKFDEDSKKYAEKGHFNQQWDELYNVISLSSLIDFNGAGYELVESLTAQTAIDVYWDPDYYQKITDKDGNVKVYSKNLLEKRRKSVLRSIVEHYFNTGFNNVLEKRVGLPEGSLPENLTLDISLRNFAFTPMHFNKKDFHGEKGFLKELDHHIAYLKALRSRTMKFVDLAEKEGGFNVLIRNYRKALIKDLLEEAPLRSCDEEKDNEYLKKASQFILKNADVFDYDILYASDESVKYIKQNNYYNEVESSSPYTDLVYDEGQLNLIKAEGVTADSTVETSFSSMEEKSQCLAKMITMIYPNISNQKPANSKKMKEILNP